MKTVSTVKDLKDKLEKQHLAADKIQILSDIADALMKPVDGGPKSNDPHLGSQAFWNYFSNVLLVHHATNEEKFKKKTFEFAFSRAMVAMGLSAKITASPTFAGPDVTVQDNKQSTVAYSLKTEADQQISKRAIKISKFMEARWIRECRDKPDRGTIAIRKIEAHLEKYQRILILRAFDHPNAIKREAVEYHLVEVKKETLLLLNKLTDEEFTKPTKNNTFGAAVMQTIEEKQQKVYTLRMDGSVEKVTISGLSTDSCILHATWVVPVDPVVELDEYEKQVEGQLF